jgi:hypothetical protein
MQRLQYVLAISAFLIPASALAQQPQDPSPHPGAKLDRKDPNYVRCVSQVETGSLVKKRKICRTNADWSKADAAGSRDAEDIQLRTRQGFDPRGAGGG